jgi:hypothetical protein
LEAFSRALRTTGNDHRFIYFFIREIIWMMAIAQMINHVLYLLIL